jgi:protein involved in ribonucleotide reduction
LFLSYASYLLFFSYGDNTQHFFLKQKAKKMTINPINATPNKEPITAPAILPLFEVLLLEPD